MIGVGLGAAETVSNDLALSNAPATKAGAASAISETAYELGAVLGTAILGSLLTAVYRAKLVLPDGLSGVAERKATETLAGAVEVSGEHRGELGTSVGDAAAMAFESGVTAAAIASALCVTLAAIAGAVLVRKSAVA